MYRPFLSHFERTRAISLRAEALAHGAPTTLDGDVPESVIDIARLEFERGLIPSRLRRRYPDGTSRVVDIERRPGRQKRGGKREAAATGAEAATSNRLIKSVGAEFRGAFVGASPTTDLWSTAEAEYSVTRARDKKALRAVVEGLGVGAGTTVLDGTANVGSDTSLFAAYAGRVISVELDPTNFAALEHNVAALGLGGKVTVINGDVKDVMRAGLGAGEAPQVAYFDPPWGGKDYDRGGRTLSLKLGGTPMRELVELVPPSVRHVVLKLPHNHRMGVLRGRTRVYAARLSAAQLKAARANPHCAERGIDLGAITECPPGERPAGCGAAGAARLLYAHPHETDADIADDGGLPPASAADAARLVPLVSDIAVPAGVRYTPQGQRVQTVAHLGQLKLFLSTMQFLSEYAPEGPRHSVHVVYPGSAHGYNLLLLSRLFPQCKWYLQDEHHFDPRLRKEPATFEIEDKYVYASSEDPFMADLRKRFEADHAGETVLLISDIRLENTEKQVDIDMRLQMDWVETLRPSYAQLKYRLPFAHPGYTETVREYEYLAPHKNYVQMYAPAGSTECRLVVKRPEGGQPYPKTMHDEIAHENAMYFFNRRIRCADHSKHMGGVKPAGTDGCHDCALMMRTLRDYLERYPDNGVAADAAALHATIMTEVRSEKMPIGTRVERSLADVEAALVAPGEEKAGRPFVPISVKKGDGDGGHGRGLATQAFLMRGKPVKSGKMMFAVFDRVAGGDGDGDGDGGGSA